MKKIRLKSNGWLARIFNIHYPINHVDGVCWCQKKVSGW